MSNRIVLAGSSTQQKWHRRLVRRGHQQTYTGWCRIMSRMALSSDALVIVSLPPKDCSAVRAIYLEGIATGNSTFEKSAPEWDTWDRDHLPTCRLTARCGDEIVGWAALSPVSRRTVYAGVRSAERRVG